MARPKRLKDPGDFLDFADAHFDLRQNREQAASHGNLSALYDELCLASMNDLRRRNGLRLIGPPRDRQDDVLVPRWAVGLLCDVVMNATFDLHGRKTWRAIWRSDMVDWRRWQEVYRFATPEPGEPKYPWRPSPRALQLAGGVAAKRKAWKRTVFGAAQESFADTIYAGTIDEIRKSWERVNSELKRGHAWRYYYALFMGYSYRQDHGWVDWKENAKGLSNSAKDVAWVVDPKVSWNE